MRINNEGGGEFEGWVREYMCVSWAFCRILQEGGKGKAKRAAFFRGLLMARVKRFKWKLIN